MNPQQIIAQLEQLDKRLVEAIKKIIGNNPTQEKLLNFLASDQFDQLINELGLNKIVTDYVSGFDLGLRTNLDSFGLQRLTDQQILRISTNLDLIKNTYARTILGFASANKELLRVKLIGSVISGATEKVTRAELEGRLISSLTNAPLNTAQIGTVINTSYADYSRATTAEVFKDKTEQRFFYYGGVIPTSSDECRWLYKNQRPEGYTRAEIDAGIETPFVYTYGELKGQIKKIYWNGRFPNYNCIHEWKPILGKQS